ncbi:MAG: hypothetical protein SCJ94_02300 [Bacillota bacterium]|nr:hypothetical protein [Bacillota bacterium]
MTMKINKKNSAGLREIALLSVLVAVLMISLFWHCFVSSMYSDLNYLYQEREQLLADINHFQKIVDNKESIVNERANLEDEAVRVNTLLPAFSELPVVLGNLDIMLSKFSDSIISIKAGDINHEEDYTTMSLTLQAKDQAWRLQNIVYELEQFPHLLIINNINISGLDSSESTLDIRFHLYFNKME